MRLKIERFIMKQYIYATLSVEKIESVFNTNTTQGLTTAYAKRHKAPTQVTYAYTNWFILLIQQLKSPFIYLLIIAAILSYFLEGFVDFFVISFIIIINTALGFVQEYRAQKAALLLKKHAITHAKVIRDGILSVLKSDQLVSGDLLNLEAGDKIPADVRFIVSNDLTVDESSLSGESLPVRKSDKPLKQEPQSIYHAHNLGFEGTAVISGSAKAFVIASVGDTLLASMSALASSVNKQSSFQKNITQLSKLILISTLIALATVFALHIILKPTYSIELILFSIALALSVVPEALPVVITIALSQGALLLARHKVIVKRLSAIEDLGNITVLCTDKTGTLTENKLQVKDVYAIEKTDPLLMAAIASAQEHNPFEKTLYHALNIQDIKTLKTYTFIDYIPFTPVKRYSSVLVKNNDYIIISLGAPEDIIKLCNSHTIHKKEIDAWIIQQTTQARRVLAVSYKHLSLQPHNIEHEEHAMILSGIIAFEDPLKSTARQAVVQAKELGVTIKMLTGDSYEVAYSMGKSLRIIQSYEEIITGNDYQALTEKEKEKAVQRCSVFARVIPQQKASILSLLKKVHNVGFLGEGINDAPALKTANVALAVSGAADIAQDAADILLLKKSLAVIVQGINLGRGIFVNTVKYIKITLVGNLGNFCSIALASLIVTFLPMSALQILLVNVLTDLPMVAIATDTVDLRELERPQNYNTREILTFSILFGLISSCIDLVLFSIYFQNKMQLQTNWFMLSILTELTLIFSLRTHMPFYKATRPSIMLISFAAGAGLIALILPFTTIGSYYFSFIKPTSHEILIIFLLVISYFCLTELTKLWYYKN